MALKAGFDGRNKTVKSMCSAESRGLRCGITGGGRTAAINGVRQETGQPWRAATIPQGQTMIWHRVQEILHNIIRIETGKE